MYQKVSPFSFFSKLIFIVILKLSFVFSIQAQCVTATRVNNLNISLDQQNNQLLISGLDCDPCLYLTEVEHSACECHNDCDSDYKGCKDDCIENSTSIEKLVQCLNTCALQETSCRGGCGVKSQPSRTPISYTYTMNFWWTTGLVETMNGPPNQIFTSTTTIGASPDPIVINLMDDLSELQVSYCYITQVLVEYDDGTCCLFRDSECLNRG